MNRCLCAKARGWSLRASVPSHLRVLPDDFYAGRTRAYRAIALVLILVVAGFSVLTVSGQMDPGALLGPHVQRSEWVFTMTGARDLNARGLTGKGITVCVVDSGIDALHPDFAHSSILAWRDFVNSRTDPYDDRGHGTHMASIIAASGSLHGVAPGVALIVVKVIDSSGEGNPQNVADGIRFCVDPWGNGRPGSDIISISLGSKGHLFAESRVYDAAAWALGRGVLVVASAGNDGLADDGDVEIPSVVPLAISVGAVDANGLRPPFSSIGSRVNRTDPNLKPELVAPGVRLISSSPGAHYVTITGTSPAAALVAGILSLILEARPSLRPAGSTNNVVAVKMALAAGARKVPGQTLPHDPWYGYGIINGPATLANL